MNKDYHSALLPLREIIANHNLKAEKSLGQNFLLDRNITDKIVRSSGDLSGQTVVEIGPGPGGLTRSLLNSAAANIIAIEYDPRAVHALQDLQQCSEGRLQIIQEDALQIDFLSISTAPRTIIANLPYNIATPLLISWLSQIRADFKAYDCMILMFQKEVAQRIAAKPGQKAYGRLSILSQWLCDVDILFDLPPSVFTPAPKVKSSIVKFKPKDLETKQPDFKQVELVTAAAFNQRRKMIKTSLKDYEQKISLCGLDPTWRAENLSVEDYVNLAL